MEQVVDIISQNPANLISKEFLESNIPLVVVKSCLDEVITLNKSLVGARKTALDEIAIEGLDANQVWLQAKMVLDNVQADLLERISVLRSTTEAFDSDESNEESEYSQEFDVEDELVSAEDFNSADEEKSALAENPSHDEDNEEQNRTSGDEEEQESEGESKAKFEDAVEFQNEEYRVNDKYGVNDKFFDLEEFNKQTLAAENNKEELLAEDESDIDYFADIASDTDEEALYYDDFFDKPKVGVTSQSSGSRDEYADEVDSEMDEEAYNDAIDNAKLDLFADEEVELEKEGETTSGKKLSTFERQQLEIQKQIEQLEQESIAEKKWALKGEVKAKERPDDALLTEDLEFDRTSKPVPVITSDVTESLEDMIRRKIKDGNFDDLERRVINDIVASSQRTRFELSDVKSSKSLGELDENDLRGVSEDSATSEELKKSHEEISQLYNDLVYKLDALSSASFIPKPPQKSLEVKVQTAAISMEDAQPLTMSTASTLAPQEIYSIGKAENKNEIALKNGVVMSKDELTKADKNRLRRAVKRKRANAIANKGTKKIKKSKKDEVMETLGKAKNITVINSKGEKQDLKGNAKKNEQSTASNSFKL